MTDQQSTTKPCKPDADSHIRRTAPGGQVRCSNDWTLYSIHWKRNGRSAPRPNTCFSFAACLLLSPYFWGRRTRRRQAALTHYCATTTVVPLGDNSSSFLMDGGALRNRQVKLKLPTCLPACSRALVGPSSIATATISLPSSYLHRCHFSALQTSTFLSAGRIFHEEAAAYALHTAALRMEPWGLATEGRRGGRNRLNSCSSLVLYWLRSIMQPVMPPFVDRAENRYEGECCMCRKI